MKKSMTDYLITMVPYAKGFNTYRVEYKKGNETINQGHWMGSRQEVRKYFEETRPEGYETVLTQIHK